jgi:hypothetical protein
MLAAARRPGMGEGAQRALRVAAILFFLSLVVFAKFHGPTRFLDLRNRGDLDLPLVVRVHDRAHNLQFQDRFNLKFALHAHERLEVAIPIAEIEHAPGDQLINLSRIAGLIVFRDRGTMAGSFEVERILLRR